MSADELAPDAEAFRARATARRRARLWLSIAGIPLALAGLAVSAKLLSMYGFANQAITAFARSDAAGTVAAAEALQPFDYVERWIAPYDLGVGLATGEQLAEARAEFETALEHATGYDVCPVRINLALVIERMGDDVQAESPQEAAALYDEALTITAETPEECRSEEAQQNSPDPERDPNVSLDGLEERLTQKQTETPPEQQEPSDEPDDEQEQQGSSPDSDALDQLEDQLESGARDREESGRDDDGEGSGSQAEKPW